VTGVDDLVTWLRAQLDDDERVTRQVIAEPGGFYIEAETEDVNVMTVGAYVYRWTPKRILAEVDAKRRTVERHAPEDDGLHSVYCKWCSTPQCGAYEPWPCPDLLGTAAPFADRPGYREEWRP
jgi:hypothetical protein